MPDSAGFAHLVLPLSLLGLVSSAVASLFVAFMMRSIVGGVLVLLILVGSSVFGVVKSFVLADKESLKSNAVFTSFFALVGGIIAVVLRSNFFSDAGYLNRVMVFMLVLFAMLLAFGSLWIYVTQCLSQSCLEASGVDQSQEQVLYFVWAGIVAFVMAWFVTLRSAYYFDDLVKFSVIDSVGWWFAGGLLAALLGVLILFKAGSQPQGTKSAPLRPAGEDAAEYDRVL